MASKRTLALITCSIVFLTFVSCIISICCNDIYQDGAWANAQWLGQDSVTLFLALPALIVSFIKGIRAENRKWALIYSGILFYYFYTYSFFMFAANLTVLYLFHLPIYGLSVIGLVLALISLFSEAPVFAFQNPALKIIIIVYLFIISLIISFLWLNDIVLHLVDPDHLSDTPDGKAPLIIYSLDLAIVIPLMVASAVFLIRKSKPGYILNGIILTKTTTLGFALMAMSVSMYLNKLNPDYFLIILWCVIGLIGLLLTIFYLKNLRADDKGVE